MTSPISHADIVVLAVYLLGQGRAAVDTEDVAIKAHELAPTRFCWRKHPEQINLELVRVSLSDAKKSEKGAYLAGSGKTGWSLTPAGLRWALSAATALEGGDLTRTREEGRGGSIDEQRWRRERERIVASRAWAQWSSGSLEIDARDAAEVFRIDSYADGRMRSMKIARLESLFEADREILGFIRLMGQIINGQEQGNG